MNRAITSYVAFAAQVFLGSAVLWVLALLYRWDSLHASLSSAEILSDMVAFLPVFALIACLVALLMWPVAALLAVRYRESRTLVISVARAIFVMAFFYGFFVFLNFWGKATALEVSFHVRMAGAIVIPVLLAVLVGLAVIYHRGALRRLDRVQKVGVLLFAFALLLAITALTRLVIENRLTYPLLPWFERYGWLLFIGYAVLFRREIVNAMRHSRVWLVTAGVLTVVSLPFFFVSIVGDESRAIFDIAKTSTLSDNKPEHIILISFEALPADQMSLYGNPLPSTPNIDRFARVSSVFENTHANADQTHFSIPSIHTGSLIYTTRLKRLGAFLAKGNIIGYMPTVFDRLGWETAYMLIKPYSGTDDIFRRLLAYNDAQPAFLDAYYGHGSRERRILQQVVLRYTTLPAWMLANMYDDIFGAREFDWGLDSSDPPGSVKFAYARDYISDNLAKNFFLWIHQFPVHTGYGRYMPFEAEGTFLKEPVQYQDVVDAIAFKGVPYPPEKQPLVDQLKQMQQEYLAATDAEFGLFLDFLEENGLFENSMIIVTADHGEAFAKGEINHGTGLMYEQTLHVPLVIHLPGQTEARRIPERVQLIDIMPTILDAVDVAQPEYMEGTTLLPLTEGRTDALFTSRATFATTIPGVARLSNNVLLKALYTFVVYQGDFKLIYRVPADFYLQEIPVEADSKFAEFFGRYPRIELFNLANDPKENRNLAEREPQRVTEMMELIETQIEKTRQYREQTFR